VPCKNTTKPPLNSSSVPTATACRPKNSDTKRLRCHLPPGTAHPPHLFCRHSLLPPTPVVSTAQRKPDTLLSLYPVTSPPSLSPPLVARGWPSFAWREADFAATVLLITWMSCRSSSTLTHLMRSYQRLCSTISLLAAASSALQTSVCCARTPRRVRNLLLCT
jgi:hypothetical protein